ncbi:MAG: S-layer homology domain-containing protein, partial [bacterium]|nr:S-layer homology domain-containing protein [bacterium]
MKKFLITILAALVAGGMVSAMGHVSFPDIRAGHWAGGAVAEVADLGIVIGFPDGTFRGTEAFTRYQSALVVSRLLAVIDANMDAELGSLRAAMQSMAAGMATQGVRLAAAESAIAAISDDVAGNAAAIAARIDALEAAMAAMPMGMDEAVLRDLQNQLASARVAVDTAQAQAEAAEARANGAYDLALQALAASDANASDIAVMNQVVQLLAKRVEGLSGPAPMAPEVDLSGVDRNAGDIANIREFAILLRREQVALRGRVSALEAADVATAASIAGLEGRVAALEAKPFIEFSGSIGLSYQVGRIIGDVFDVDRAYGVNNPRGMGNSAFSTGTSTLSGGTTGAGNDPGERAQDRADIEEGDGNVVATLTLNVSGGNKFDGAGSSRGLNSFASVAEIDVKKGFIADDSSFSTGFEGYIFRVKSFTTTFKGIGGTPLTFDFGEQVSASFTTYVFNAVKLDGYVANVSAPDFLAFLNPGLQAAYFSDTTGGYWRGIRGTMAPSFGDAITLSGGVSFAQAATLASDKDDVDADNVTATVWGLDGEVGLLGLVDLAFEYASSTADSVLWVTANVGGNLPILNSLGGNYRAVDLSFDGIGTTGDKPFERGQTGFGVEAGLGLFMLDVTGFFDSYTNETSSDANVGYGAKVSADLFAGFSLAGFYEAATVGGTLADATANVSKVDAGYTLLDGNYTTKFGVGIMHDGKADDALISGLNIAAGYERWEADYSRTRMYANADYSLSVSIITLTPYAGYESDSDTDDDRRDFTEISAGTGVTTSALDMFLEPSLQAAVNYRTASYSGNVSAFTSTELQWSVGVTLEEFLLPYSSLSARVGSWTGTNMTKTLATLNDGISAGRSVKDVDRGELSEALFGYEVTW